MIVSFSLLNFVCFNELAVQIFYSFLLTLFIVSIGTHASKKERKRNSVEVEKSLFNACDVQIVPRRQPSTQHIRFSLIQHHERYR